MKAKHIIPILAAALAMTACGSSKTAVYDIPVDQNAKMKSYAKMLPEYRRGTDAEGTVYTLWADGSVNVKKADSPIFNLGFTENDKNVYKLNKYRDTVIKTPHRIHSCLILDEEYAMMKIGSNTVTVFPTGKFDRPNFLLVTDVTGGHTVYRLDF